MANEFPKIMDSAQQTHKINPESHLFVSAIKFVASAKLEASDLNTSFKEMLENNALVLLKSSWDLVKIKPWLQDSGYYHNIVTRAFLDAKESDLKTVVDIIKTENIPLSSDDFLHPRSPFTQSGPRTPNSCLLCIVLLLRHLMTQSSLTSRQCSKSSIVRKSLYLRMTFLKNYFLLHRGESPNF